MNKTVLITGIAGGIGAAVGARMGAASWRVVGADLRPFEAPWLNAHHVVDLRERGALLDVVTGQDLHGVVHCAAMMNRAPLSNTSVDEWDEVMAVNLRSAFELLKGGSASLRRNRGSAVLISSVHARATSLGAAAYAASKGGLEAFVRASALELGPEVCVVGVAPGAVDTPMLPADDDTRRELARRTPGGRIATPAEIAGLVCFFLSDDAARFVTGETLVADGGVLAQLGSER